MILSIAKKQEKIKGIKFWGLDRGDV
ncbi:MAG: hypothetical protein ACD_15C00001G0004, partial [uncultured bacterium]